MPTSGTATSSIHLNHDCTSRPGHLMLDGEGMVKHKMLYSCKYDTNIVLQRIPNCKVIFHISRITKDFNKKLENIIIMLGVIISQCEKCYNICTCNLIKNMKICIQCKKQYSSY